MDDEAGVEVGRIQPLSVLWDRGCGGNPYRVQIWPFGANLKGEGVFFLIRN